jgi:hypothetical protein
VRNLEIWRGAHVATIFGFVIRNASLSIGEQRGETEPMSIPSVGLSRDAEPLAVKPKRACAMLDCGITRLYELMSAGELVGFKDGRSRKITTASLHGYLARRIAESQVAKPQVA